MFGELSFMPKVSAWEKQGPRRQSLKEIYRLNYGCCISINNDKLEIKKIRRIYDFFTSKPESYYKALRKITNSFINESKSYFDLRNDISLTSGFDGRTVVAVAKYHGVEFQTFSYGKEIYSDVNIPQKLSKKLNFKYVNLSVDELYIKERHINYVRQYLKYSGGMNGFLYPMPLYSADNKDRGANTIITGYCGSELLRNPHFGGAVTSQFIIDYLRFSKNKFFENLKNYSIFKNDCLKYDEENINILYNKIDAFFSNLPSELSLNQQIAVFEFEETQPKIFGTWVYAGMHYQRIRVPFMDPQFFSKIAKAKVSQFYRKFMEQNPLKWYIGQRFYSEIIKKTWSDIGKIISGKGYSPEDLITFKGKFRLIKGYIQKERKKGKANYDNLSLISGLEYYINTNKPGSPNNEDFFGRKDILFHNEKLRDCIFNKFSSYEFNKMLK